MVIQPISSPDLKDSRPEENDRAQDELSLRPYQDSILKQTKTWKPTSAQLYIWSLQGVALLILGSLIFITAIYYGLINP